MSNIADKQTVLISVNLFTFATVAGPPVVETKSQVSLPMNLRFAADELIVKNISYNGAISPNQATVDIQDIVNIWCDKTNDGFIGSFPNAGDPNVPVFCQHNEHFRLSNSFQTGNFVLQFQQSGAGGMFSTVASYGPQPLISALAVQTTFGVVSITLEFVKLKNKDIY